jgi:phenylacetate-CoA ligase
LSSLYDRLPTLGQHLAVTAYGVYWHWVRFGRGYGTVLGEYLAREAGTESEMRRAVEDRTRKLLAVAVGHVPFYRTCWTDSQKRSAMAGRLSELPLLDKEPVRADPLQFLDASRNPRPRLSDSTSGSTGTPVRTYWTLAERRESMALREARSLKWAGVSYTMPRATFSGRLVEPRADSRGPFYRFNAVERQVYLSAFHLRPDTARSYVEALRRHGVQWLTGYAVSFYLLGLSILDQGLLPPPLKAIITTSEKLTREMREVMERAYGCRVYEEYSSVENAMFAGECEHRRLHVSPDAGVVEILREDGTPCGPGEVGEVVATCLFRTYQPLVRYRIGDLAAWDDRPCPCNRPMPVLREVVGRLEDVVVGPDGRQMVRFHGIFVDQPHIREGQIVQETLDRIRVKVVPAGQFGPRDEQDVIERVQQRLGSQVSVVVQVVDFIPRTKAGKFQAVVSLLKRASDPRQ